VKQEKPFAFIDGTPAASRVLQTAVAADKTLVFGNSGVSYQDTIDQAPYRWGTADGQAGAVMAAEWAGEAVGEGQGAVGGRRPCRRSHRTHVRRGGDNSATDIDQFLTTFKSHGGKLATPALEHTAKGGFHRRPDTTGAAAGADRHRQAQGTQESRRCSCSRTPR
jgi:hypothetical protein